MYMPLETEQSDGYGAFREPGVMRSLYLASYIPTVDLVAITSTTQLIQAKKSDTVE